jgi:phosphoribosylformimino-5-aminoimidazole carboxamide ribotide isomerase
MHKFHQMGIRRAIMLDLARVGSEEGIDVAFVRRVVESLNVEVFVGGGVRSISDLEELNGIGVAGALLATSLHSGKITAEQIVAKGLSLV